MGGFNQKQITGLNKYTIIITILFKVTNENNI